MPKETEKGGLKYDLSQARKLVLNTEIDVPDPGLHTGTLYHAAWIAEHGSQLSSVVEAAQQPTLAYLAKKNHWQQSCASN